MTYFQQMWSWKTLALDKSTRIGQKSEIFTTYCDETAAAGTRAVNGLMRRTGRAPDFIFGSFSC